MQQTTCAVPAPLTTLPCSIQASTLTADTSNPGVFVYWINNFMNGLNVA